MIIINENIQLADDEVEISAIRASGAGGQNVNKVSSAIHLQFDIKASGLPDYYKEQLLKFSDQRISKEGVVVIKSQQFRTREKNKEEAFRRLIELINLATLKAKKRKPTRSTLSSQRKRMDKKTQRGKTKNLRGKIKL